MSLRTSAVLIAFFFVGMQWFVLPPDGFMTGDQGSKYLQTRAFAEQGPLNPAIDVKSRDIDPLYRHQEPKLKNRRGRLVSEFMWLLPMTAAPFMWAFGMRGMYLVSALSALVVFFGAARLARRDGDPHGTIAAWTVLLVTPIVFYGLELWEHAPAAACVIVAAALLMPRRDSDAPRRNERVRFTAAGAAVACGFLFREEAVVALPALLIARTVTLDRDRVKSLVVATLWSGAGAAVVFIASMPVNMMMYGAPLPMHMTQDAWEYARNISYIQVRRDIVVELFLPAEHAAIYAAAMIAGIAAALYASRRANDSPGALAVVHVAVAVTIGIGVGLPLWWLASGMRLHQAYQVTSAAHTWAFMPALLYWPWLGASERRPFARFLLVAAALAILFTYIVVPSTGGSQWSPRFLLQIAPLLAIPAAEIAWTSSPRRSLTLAVRTVLVAALMMQATGVVFLYRAKTRYATITHTVAQFTAAGETIISDVYWFPEVTSTLAPTRRMLFSWTSADVPAMAALPVHAGFDKFSLVTYAVLTRYLAPRAIDIPGEPCRFVRGREFGLDQYGLVLSRYSCPSR